MTSDRARAIVDYFANGCGGCSNGAPCTGDDAACADRQTQERYVHGMLDAGRPRDWEPGPVDIAEASALRLAEALDLALGIIADDRPGLDMSLYRALTAPYRAPGAKP